MSDKVFTEINVFPLKNQTGPMKAHGTVLIAGAVEVRFTVIQGSNGIFASLPARKSTKPNEEGKYIWYPDVKILNEEMYKKFQLLVENEYSKVTGASSQSGEENQAAGGYEDGLPF